MPLPVKTKGCSVRELVFQSVFIVAFSVLFHTLLYFYMGKNMVCNSFLIKKKKKAGIVDIFFLNFFLL